MLPLIRAFPRTCAENLMKMCREPIQQSPEYAAIAQGIRAILDDPDKAQFCPHSVHAVDLQLENLGEWLILSGGLRDFCSLLTQTLDSLEDNPGRIDEYIRVKPGHEITEEQIKNTITSNMGEMAQWMLSFMYNCEWMAKLLDEEGERQSYGIH